MSDDHTDKRNNIVARSTLDSIAARLSLPLLGRRRLGNNVDNREDELVLFRVETIDASESDESDKPKGEREVTTFVSMQSSGDMPLYYSADSRS
jgi:hypothetical protein